MTDKFCKDCKHSRDRTHSGGIYMKCDTRNFGTDPTTGKPITEYAATQRRGSLAGRCGPDAIFFEPRVPFLQRMIFAALSHCK